MNRLWNLTQVSELIGCKHQRLSYYLKHDAGGAIKFKSNGGKGNPKYFGRASILKLAVVYYMDLLGLSPRITVQIVRKIRWKDHGHFIFSRTDNDFCEVVVLLEDIKNKIKTDLAKM